MTKRRDRKLDAHIQDCYKRHAAGRTINVLDIGKVFAAGEQAHAAGGDVEAAIKAAVEQYCSPRSS